MAWTTCSLLPQVPVEEISDYINACDVMLVPLAKDEIFSSFIPSKMFDYMACARPIILAVDGEARAIMEEAGAGVYVEPDNPAALPRYDNRASRAFPVPRKHGRTGQRVCLEALPSRYPGRGYWRESSAPTPGPGRP